jgi:hypothetical protein
MNKADRAHCRAFVFLIYVTVALVFLLAVGLFQPSVVGAHRPVSMATSKQRR